ncbi:MAG TPA: hypothetical protein VGD06_16400 [Acidobacteriota bacterium]
MRTRLSLFLALVAALSLATGTAYSMQNADVTGKWTMTFSIGDNERTLMLDLTQDGTNITGTSQAEGQEEPSPVTGTIEGNNITLNISGGLGGRGGRGAGRRGGGGRGPTAWEGTVDGDTMSGTRSMRGRGGETQMQWTAKRTS